MDYISLGCCTLAFLLYYNTLNNGFVYDDRRAIISNPDVSGNTPWQNIFIHDFWGTPITDTGTHGSYRPLCVLSFRLNFILNGYSSNGYHLVNNLLHCLATGLVVKVARQLLSSVWGVLVTGALFAAHPIHTEAVAGIVGRADLFTCICHLIAFLFYIRHMIWRSKHDIRQWMALGCTIITSITALLFKETGITSLVICGMFDVICWLSGKHDKYRLRSLCVILSSFICLLYIRLIIIPRPRIVFATADNPIARMNSLMSRFLTFLYLPLFNFQLLLNPKILCFDWGMDAITRITTIFDKRNLLSISFYGTLIYLIRYCLQILLKQSKNTRCWKTGEFGTILHGDDDDGDLQYNLQRKYQRVSRTKRKHEQQKQNSSSDNLFVINDSSNCNKVANNFNIETNMFNCTTKSKWLHIFSKEKFHLFFKDVKTCGYCKQEINALHCTSTCRVINNNNNLIQLNASNVYTNECCCQPFMSSNNVAATTHSAAHNMTPSTYNSFSVALCKAFAAVVTTRSSRSSSSCSNSTTSSNKSYGSNASSIYSSTSSKSSTSSSLSSTSSSSLTSSTLLTTFDANWGYIHGSSLLCCTSPNCTNACIILLLLTFLILPFLLATNLFFYVGFVVAERILYLPSVGFCLLIGFGISKLMDHLQRRKNWRMKKYLLISLLSLLCIFSVRTIVRNRDWKDEESLYGSAIQVNPPKALGNLGSVLSSKARYAEAEFVLLEALKYRPNMADVHFNLGILYQNQKRYKLAVESFKNALHFRPNLAVAYLNLGISLLALGRCHEAIQILQDGTKVNGSGVRDRTSHDNARISSYLQLGALYTEQGKLQRALAIYRESLYELPYNYHMRDVLYYRIGDIFGRLKQWDEAERHHRAALNLQPNEVGSYLSFGITLARNSSRAAEAEFWFKKALKLAPNQASVYHHYAEFLTSTSRNAEAIFYRIKAAELAPNDYALVVSAATTLRLENRKAEAELWYRRAVNLRPQDAHAHTNLGAILHLLGQTSKAAVSYREALRLQPGDVTTLGNLAKLGLTNMK